MSNKLSTSRAPATRALAAIERLRAYSGDYAGLKTLLEALAEVCIIPALHELLDEAPASVDGQKEPRKKQGRLKRKSGGHASSEESGFESFKKPDDSNDSSDGDKPSPSGKRSKAEHVFVLAFENNTLHKHHPAYRDTVSEVFTVLYDKDQDFRECGLVNVSKASKDEVPKMDVSTMLTAPKINLNTMLVSILSAMAKTASKPFGVTQPIQNEEWNQKSIDSTAALLDWFLFNQYIEHLGIDSMKDSEQVLKARQQVKSWKAVLGAKLATIRQQKDRAASKLAAHSSRGVLDPAAAQDNKIGGVQFDARNGLRRVSKPVAAAGANESIYPKLDSDEGDFSEVESDSSVHQRDRLKSRQSRSTSSTAALLRREKASQKALDEAASAASSNQLKGKPANKSGKNVKSSK